MKKIYLALLGACALAAAPADAKDFVSFLQENGGKINAYSRALGDEASFGVPNLVSGTDVIEYVGKEGNFDRIRISNFLDRYESVDFLVSGSTIKLASIGERVNVYNDIVYGYKNFSANLYFGGILTDVRSFYDDEGSYYRNREVYANARDKSREWSGSIIENTDGTFAFRFTTPLYEEASIANYYDQLYKAIDVFTFVANATITETVKDYTGSLASGRRSYPARIDINRDAKTFEITNLHNIGVPVQLYMTGGESFAYNTPKVSGKLVTDADNNITGLEIPSTEMGSTVENYVVWMSQNDGYYYPRDFYTYKEVIGTIANNDPTDFDNAIKGTVSLTRVPEHSLRAGSPLWTADDGGELKTTEAVRMTLDNYVYAMDDQDYGHFGLPTPVEREISDTKILIDEKDLTLSADIPAAEASIPATDLENVYIKGNIATLENHDYLDSYELFLTPGLHSSIAGKETDFSHPDNGHVKAISLAKYEVSEPATADATAKPGERQFSVRVPATVCGDLHDSGVGYEYTLFLKANYKDESKLAPTFHALTPLTISVPTAISDLNPDAISISAGEGVIYANGFVSVYTLQGQKVYEGNAAEIAAAPGLYVVKAAGKTVKVLVK